MGDGSEQDTRFIGSIPALYERYLVPMIFQSYADDLAERLAAVKPNAVLEIACGTGVVTRALAARIPSAAITATDLNQPMLDHAQTIGVSRPVTWQQADAMGLPFDDSSFDAVVCQFGVMFFPDRPRALTEMRRVLRPGGTLLFNVWESLQFNEFAHVVLNALADLFPDDPPRFMDRVPHGYFDPEQIRSDLAAGGFPEATIEMRDARSKGATAKSVATAFCQGTPVRNEIEARDPNGLARATAAATIALAERFGATDLNGLIRALIITTQKR
jgi:SAM-dependent methyltransferase